MGIFGKAKKLGKKVASAGKKVATTGMKYNPSYQLGKKMGKKMGGKKRAGSTSRTSVDATLRKRKAAMQKLVASFAKKKVNSLMAKKFKAGKPKRRGREPIKKGGGGKRRRGDLSYRNHQIMLARQKHQKEQNAYKK